MIRQDYFLRILEEFARRLARIAALRKDGRTQEAAVDLETEFKNLVGLTSKEVVERSPLEVIARIIQSAPSLEVADRLYCVVDLLREAGDLSQTGPRPADREIYYARALGFLLGSVGGTELSEVPRFVPTMEGLLGGVREEALPMPLRLAIMHYYERTGQFARGEDCLFRMLDEAPGDPRLIELGIGFYERLRLCAEETLVEGGLTRAEVESGLSEVRRTALPESS